MKVIKVLPLFLLVFSPALGERAVRRSEKQIRDVARPIASLIKTNKPRRLPAASLARSDALKQAPGVVQFNLFDPSRITWFVTTETLPVGTIIAPFIIFPNGVEYPLSEWELTEELEAGTSLILPSFYWMESFWPIGVLTYDVVVDRGGEITHTAADYVTGGARRNAEDTAGLFPLIKWVVQLGTAEKPELIINGSFRESSSVLLLEDLIVPTEAIKEAKSWSITIDLTKVPGFSLDLLQEFLVSICQEEWCDTMVSFRYVPQRR